MRDKNTLADKNIFFIIIIGMSGAGKTSALNALEDSGYYCVDNLHPELIPSLYKLCNNEEDKETKVAVVTNIRNRSNADSLAHIVDTFEEKNIEYKILYLDANDGTLINRYKETRRTHPLNSICSSLDVCVETEREYLRDIKDRSDFMIDSSNMSSLQLKQKVNMLFTGSESGMFTVRCVAFGFKYGIPHDADLVFDTRCFPNPFYIKELKELTGLDKPVEDYVMSFPQTQKFLNMLFSFMDYMIPLYQSEGKSELVVAIGCTGGKHRSVAIAHSLSDYLKEKKYRSLAFYRDISKKR